MTRGRPRKPVPQAAIEKVRSGYSVYSVAKTHGVGYATLYRACKDDGIDITANALRRYIQKSKWLSEKPLPLTERELDWAKRVAEEL